MRKCEHCKNMIPEDMKICPHCGLLPPTLYPQFFLYLALTLIAAFAAFYYRPFLNGPALGAAAEGTLWVAFCIFAVFMLIFGFVSVVLLRAYKNRSYKGKITKAERDYFIRMKKHIEAGSHKYEGKYCTICGHRK